MRKYAIVTAVMGAISSTAFAGSYPSGFDPNWPKALRDSGYQDPADLMQRAEIQLLKSDTYSRNNLVTNQSYERVTVPCNSGYLVAADLGWPSPGVHDTEIQGLPPSQYRVSFEHTGQVYRAQNGAGWLPSLTYALMVRGTATPGTQKFRAVGLRAGGSDGYLSDGPMAPSGDIRDFELITKC